MRSICVIVNRYPNAIEPTALVFVQQLVWSMVDQGIDCSVICPLPVNINPRYSAFPLVRTEKTENGNNVKIHHPKYVSFGQSRKILGINPAPLTTALFTETVEAVIRRMKSKPDVLYGHFITPAGIAAARLGRKYGIPAFMAYGEATYKTMNEFGIENVRRELQSLAGVIAVSTQNKEMLLSANAVAEKKIGVFPNGYRPERFYPRDKIESRKKFGFPTDKFIVGMVGSFDERKGVLRLQEAVDELEDVLFACAGKGRLIPDSKKCIYAAPVNNQELPYFLWALDAFVLPTRNEGCCNAIVEAMACGLPIISSDRSFNDDILDNTCSIRINPEDISQIRQAIRVLRDDPTMRNQFARGSLAKAQGLSINARASNIISYMDSLI